MVKNLLNVCELERLSDNEDGGWRLLSPSSIALMGAAVEYLSEAHRYHCDEDDEVTAGARDWMDAAVAALAAEMSKTMIGQILMLATQGNPDWTLPCDGGTYARETYPELYAVMHDDFIIDADFFKTPDLNGRTPIGWGTGIGLTARPTMGEHIGDEGHLLGYTELFPHNHATTQTTVELNLIDVGVPTAGSSAPFGSYTGVTPPSDSQTPFPLMQPSTVVRFIIVAK